MTRCAQTPNPTTISLIEKLLQTPLDDYRKFVIWLRECSADESYNVIKNWLDKCSKLRSLDFNPNYAIKNNIKFATRSGYLPISLRKLKADNTYLYNVLAR